MALVPLDRVETVAEGIDHAEGICLTADGRMFVGGESGQLFEIVGGGAVEVARTDGFALGLAADGAGNIYMCDIAMHCVWKINPDTGEKVVFFDGLPGRPMHSPNWGCFTSDGTYYVSDSGDWHGNNGVIWRVPPDGPAEIWDTTCSEFPNGMCLSADESELYVLETTGSRLVALPLTEGGDAGPKRLVADLPGTVPDGVSVTDDGRFVVACYRPDTIFLIASDGSTEVVASDPEGTVIAAPTNVVFTGPDLDRLIFPNLGRWHLSALSIPGVRGVDLPRPTLPAA